MNDVQAQFTRAAEAAGSHVHRADGWDALASITLDVAGDRRIAVAPTLAASREGFVQALGDHAWVPTSGEPTEVADAPVGIMHCPLGVAETGSMLVSEHHLGDRLVSMLSRILIQIVRADALVPSLDEAGEWLSIQHRPGYWALVTGPSRTADIERSLTVGVQGPQENHIILLEGA